jgi:predicted enzyme related to lactoylglutathione lyase
MILLILNLHVMKKVTGIGGIFFKCENPAMLKAWYKEHLGIDAGDYGFNFDWNMEVDPSKGSTVWSPFPQHTTHFNPSTKDFMINYRVENLEALVAQMVDKGISMLDKIETYSYGKFVHCMDPEGNKIELWEPMDG